MKKIFITGASTGIGRETALRLAEKGNIVFAGVRRKVNKIELESLNHNIKGVYIDVTSSASIEKAFSYVKKNTDKLDVLINNAGVAMAFPVEIISPNLLKQQFEVNTFGGVCVLQCFLPLLDNARVINISSIAATGLYPYLAPYCASKRALDILMNSFGLENKNNIKIISIKPASIKTPIWKKSIENTEKEFLSLNNSEKYKNEFELMKKMAQKSNENGIELKKAIDIIEKVVYEKNPKSTYNIGFSSDLAQMISKFPQDWINYCIKFILRYLK